MQNGQTGETAVEVHVGIYGWRKRCLYGVILGLMIVVLCNLVATMLLMNMLDFNLSGIGQLSILYKGVKLKGTSYILSSLVASRLSSRYRQNLTLESSYNVTMMVSDEFGHPDLSLHFWTSTRDTNKHAVEVKSPRFRVNDVKGKTLFSAEKDHVSVDTEELRVLQGGAHFSGSVQTSMLKSNLGSELMLESATRKLYMKAPTEVSIESRAADISASCLTNLHLSSTDGKINLKAPGIYIPNLESIPLMQPQPSRYFHLEAGSTSKQYQVCMCSNGKLFVAKSNGECSVNNDGIQCR